MLFKILFGIVSLLVSTHIFKLVDKLGYLRHYHRHHPGVCKTIPGVLHGSEDFAVTSKGDVFITTGLVWRFNSPAYRTYAAEKNVRGGIFFFQFSKPEKGVTPLSIKASPSFDPSKFNPHGIDIIQDETKGEHTLFVVNHPDNLPDRIEKFRFLPSSRELEHLQTYTSEKFKNLNDLAVAGPDSFYTTNLCASVGRVPALLEMLLLLKWGNVLYRNPEGKVVEAVPGLLQANGITLSNDGSSVFVSVADVLHLYTRHDNGSLSLAQELPLQTQLDNIQRHPDGHSVYIGCQPQVYKFVEADDHPEKAVAPAQVLAIPMTKEGMFDTKGVTELLLDNGDLLSGSSVAAVFDGKLLVGTVEDKLAYCDMTTAAGP